MAALEKWWGPKGGKRDFAGSGIAIEVKTTGLNSRVHHAATIDQLGVLDTGEELYLYSVGVKSEPTSQRTLPTYVEEIERQLVHSDGSADSAAESVFRQLLGASNYDPDHSEIYQSGPGIIPNPALPGRLFAVSNLDLLTIDSFKNERLPSMVRSVSYEFEITSEAQSNDVARGVVEKLLHSTSLGSSNSDQS
jgi:hypothetical protein